MTSAPLTPSRNWSIWSLKAAVLCVPYVVLVWLLNGDFFGIRLMLRLRGFWAAAYYWSVFVALYAALAFLLLAAVLFLKNRTARKA